MRGTTLSERPASVLGFEPSGRTDFTDAVRSVEAIFDGSRPDAWNTRVLRAALMRVQDSAEREFMARGSARPNPDAAPRLGSNSGQYAFRLPAADECSDAALLDRYCHLSDIHRRKVNLLHCSLDIAAMNFQQRRSGPTAELDRARQSRENLRTAALAGIAEPVRERQPGAQAVPPGMRFADPEDRHVPRNVVAHGEPVPH
jgi:hypothetical protein